MCRQGAIAALLLSVLVVSASAAPAFRVESAINETSVSTDFYKKLGGFFVDVKITNLSDKNQAITIWSQSAWSWISDAPALTVGIEGSLNNATIIPLRPGEEYKSGVQLFVGQTTKRPLTFRLGFYPFASDETAPAYALRGRKKKKNIVWSNAVTLAR